MQTLRSSRQSQKKKSLHFPCASSSLYAGPAVLRSAFPLADQSLIAPFQHLKLCIVHRHSHEKLHLSLLVFRAQMPMVFATIETTCATPLYPNKKGAVLSAQPREQLQKCNAEKSDRNGVADVDQDRVQCLRQKSPVVKYRSSSSYFAHLSITTPFPFYIFIRRYAFACFSAKKFLFNHQWRNAAAQKIKVPATFAHSSHSEP